jgi:hypothetical protein
MLTVDLIEQHQTALSDSVRLIRRWKMSNCILNMMCKHLILTWAYRLQDAKTRSGRSHGESNALFLAEGRCNPNHL